MLRYMLPRSPRSNIVYSVLGNAVSLCKLRSITLSGSYEANVLFRKFVIWLLLASKHPIPSFQKHVPGIVQLCSKKQMIWITTRRIVAAMKYAGVFWDLAIRQFPHNSRSKPVFAVPPVNSIPMLIGSANPTPTTQRVVRFKDVLPESLFLRDIISLSGNSCHALIVLLASSLTRANPFSSSQNMCVAHLR